MKIAPFACLAAALVAAAPADAGDAVLYNGKIVTLDARSSIAEAIAVRDGKVLAVGSSAEMRALAPGARAVDLGGRTVIPGLIDSHMHAIRAALFYATEVNWIGAHSIAEAMERIRAAAKAAKPGQWLIVAGGWTPQQFQEKRRPTQAELAAAAPEQPVYIQLFYSNVLLTPAGLKALKIESDTDLPGKGKLERDGEGKFTGWISGDLPAISGLFDKLPLPTFEQSVAGTKLFFRELNRLGITGVSDPGGFNLNAASYRPLFKVWRDGALTVRVTAPPVEGEANRAVSALLASALGVRPSAVSVVRGLRGRDKTVRVDGITEPEVRARLRAGEGGSR